MRYLRSLPPLVVRTSIAGVAGALLVVLGWHALGGNDPGSTLMAFPLMSIGATLFLVALGGAGIAVQRVRRGERLSPFPEDAAAAPLPRAVLLRRR